MLFIWPGPQPREPDDIAELRAGQRGAIERIRTFELALLSRVIKGREWATEVGLSEERFAMMARLYLAGTVILLDAVAECADVSAADFDSGDGLLAYVRSRGMIAEDAPAMLRHGAAGRRRELPRRAAHSAGAAARSRRHLPRHARGGVRSVRHIQRRRIGLQPPRRPVALRTPASAYSGRRLSDIS